MLSKVIRKCKRIFEAEKKREQALGKIKYFCVGRNKTGTTSLKKAFEDLGYPVGDQRVAEKLAGSHYFNDNFAPIIKYCESAQVFQDAPFSWAKTYKYIDKAYPNSKFILTIRDDAEQWHQSITSFHAQMFGNGSTPSAEDLRCVEYVRKGWVYDAVKLHGTPDDDLYNKEIMMAHYNQHNADVMAYFKDRQEDLCVINLSKEDSYQVFCDFVGEKPLYDTFPWENKTGS